MRVSGPCLERRHGRRSGRPGTGQGSGPRHAAPRIGRLGQAGQGVTVTPGSGTDLTDGPAQHRLLPCPPHSGEWPAVGLTAQAGRVLSRQPVAQHPAPIGADRRRVPLQRHASPATPPAQQHAQGARLSQATDATSVAGGADLRLGRCVRLDPDQGLTGHGVSFRVGQASGFGLRALGFGLWALGFGLWALGFDDPAA